MNRLRRAKSEITGVGLFTNTSFKKGAFVAYIDGPIQVIRKYTPSLSHQTLNWIGVGKYSWINTNKSLFKFINHSCEPNVAQVTRRKVIALKDIAEGEELTLDYSLTESEEDWVIDNCVCGTASCRGQITAIMKLPKTIYKKKEFCIPDNFKSVYQSYRR